jgi:hypothetical protein
LLLRLLAFLAKLLSLASDLVLQLLAAKPEVDHCW